MANDFFQQPITTYQGFGINPAYTTPAYMSNFRPAYASDSDPYNPYAINRGYWESVHQQYFFGPSYGTYATDPAQEDRANNWAINTAHSDMLMEGITKVGVPLAAWYGANKLFSMKVPSMSPTSGLWDRGAAFASALYKGRGLGAAKAAWATTAATQGLGAATGSVMGRAAGRVFGGGLNLAARLLGAGGTLSGAGTALGGAGAVVGGAIGSFAWPLLAGAVAAKGFNHLIAEPYVGIRRGEDAMLANTANTYVAQGFGPNLGTFGMSAGHANALAQAFMKSNIKDMGFQSGDYSAMADYGMQAGIFNDIGNLNVEQMKKRVEGMADSVKMIMAVANTNSVKEAIQYMARLKAAGVNNPGAVSRVMSELGIASGVSGTSVEQIMNTVGNQGQLVAQQLGILPVMGQRQAASIYAGFANAYKTGTIHAADMAALGGVEGATQRVMETGGRVMNSAYFRAAINSGVQLGSGNMLNVSQAFGARRAENALSAYADDQLNFGANASNYLKDHSMTDMMWNFWYDRSRATPSTWMKDGSGKLDMKAVLGLAMGRGELDPEAARAMMEDARAKMDPTYMARLQDATAATAEKQFSQRRSQDGDDMMSGVPLLGSAWAGVRQQYRDTLGKSSAIGGAFTEFRADMSDTWDSFAAWWGGRTRTKDRPLQYYTQKDGKQALETIEATASYYQKGIGEVKMDEYNDVLKSIAADAKSAPEDSEVGKLARQLQSNFGKDMDNRYTLMEYYKAKKGDVGAKAGMSALEYAKFANTGVKNGHLKVTSLTADDVNPEMDQLFRSGYRDSISRSDMLSDDSMSLSSRIFGGAGTVEAMAKNRIHKDDGAYLFDASVKSQAETGETGMKDLFEIGGKDSFYSKEFGEILQKNKDDPNSLTAEERNKLKTYQALQRASGMKASDLKKIDDSLLGLARGDTEAAGALTEQGEELRQRASSATEDAVDVMRKEHTREYRRGVKFALTKAGYDGKVVDSLDGLTDNAVSGATTEGAARNLRNSDRENRTAVDSLEKAQKERDTLKDKYGNIDALKSMGEAADNLGKAVPALSKSAEALSRIADHLTKTGDNTKLADAINRLDNTLRPLASQNGALTRNFGGR